MPGFGDSAFIVILALLLFGPKKLPELARQFGKLMGDFRRASNEFRTQMEEELRISEQAERQKQVAAIEAAAPSNSIAASIPEPEHPHLSKPVDEADSGNEPNSDYEHEPLLGSSTPFRGETEAPQEPSPVPLPIATSGELNIMPPSTGLPVASSAGKGVSTTHADELETETLHG
ncbi:MAG TPA: twin-arginine translocase TatA/TatE family subunit [Acidobacteriaceae bacterium]|nr:twin-arginine translocase TatA/TatE family subunit [Acidobacteriaceae bacterium]